VLCNIVLYLVKLVKGVNLQHGYIFEKSVLSVGLFKKFGNSNCLL
jgi:hypothetical protein